ncbi:MAG: hypothetical protein LBB45_04010 [Methanobrevibacter sp.]|nr:hypothetical protein [Candidatus Methanovirga basalitermitum]
MTKQPIFFEYSTPELAFLSLTNSPLLAKYIGKNIYNKSKTLCQAIYIINAPYDFIAKKINVKNLFGNLSTFKEFFSAIKVNDKVKQTNDFPELIGEISLVGPDKQVRADLATINKS